VPTNSKTTRIRILVFPPSDLLVVQIKDGAYVALGGVVLEECTFGLVVSCLVNSLGCGLEPPPPLLSLIIVLIR